MDRRRKAGMSPQQEMPCFVQAFLDDFWIVVTPGEEKDMQSAYEIVMQGFTFLGWTLSMSKFEEEGKLKTEGVRIGHHIETTTATRGVMDIKQERVRYDERR